MRPTEVAVPRGAGDALCDEDELLAAVSREAPQPAPRAFGSDTLTRLPPIYFIGDSRTVAFRNAIYTSEFTARTYQLRSVHLRNLHAADFFAGGSVINHALLNALATDQAVTTPDEGTRWTATHADDGTASGSAPLVLFCGLADAMRLLDELGPDADIVAWDDISRGYDVSTMPASRLVTADAALERVREITEPIALGIETLRTMGFDRIFVHGCPQIRAGERFMRLHGHGKWSRQIHPNALSKVLMLFDQAVRSIAARTTARYLSGPVDARGVVTADLTWDDVHYNAAGARAVAREVVSVLEGVLE